MKFLILMLLCLPAHSQSYGIFFYDNCDSAKQDSIVSVVKNTFPSKNIIHLPSQPFPDGGQDAIQLIHHALDFKDTLERLIVVTDKQVSASRGTSRWNLFGFSITDGVAILSTRLIGGPLFIERCRKIVIHEIMHTYGVGHCEWDCIMNPGGGYITELDKRTGLCSQCKKGPQK